MGSELPHGGGEAVEGVGDGGVGVQRLAEQAAFLVGEQVGPVVEDEPVVQVEFEGLLAQLLKGFVPADETVMHAEPGPGWAMSQRTGLDSFYEPMV